MGNYFGTLLLCFILLSCSSAEKVSLQPDIPPELPQDAALTDESGISALLDNHRERYESEVGVKIAELTAPAEFGKPEGSLGNIAADAIRFRAAREARRFINLAFIGGDSFRLNFNEGELSLAEILEFMPYENHLVLLKLSGDDVLRLADQIAERGGEPVSGMRFRLDENRARAVLVNSETVQNGNHYWLATSNYYANGGGGFTSLTEPAERVDFEDVSIRQLYIDHFRHRRVIEPQTDGRIQ